MCAFLLLFFLRSSGTSRWLRYGLFSSLSGDDPGGDAAEGSEILQTANRNLTHITCARSQSNVDASVKYVPPPAMKEVSYSFNSLGGLTWSTTMSLEWMLEDGPDPRKVDTSGASYAALVSIAEVSISKTSGATRLHQECRLRVL